MNKSVPIADDVTRFYWDAAARGELVVQGFVGTDVRQFPPEPVAIGRPDAGRPIGVTVSGRGHLYAFTVLRQAFHPAYEQEPPVILALTELDDAPGVRILTNIVEADPAELSVGTPLEVTFEDRDGVALPQFRPVRTGGDR